MSLSLDPPGLELVVLAGGRGRRLGGRVKPLLMAADGRSLIERLAEHLPGASVLIVAPSDLHAALEPARANIDRARPTRLIGDPGAGPVPAILEAARLSERPYLLVSASDHPYPSRALAERLLRCAAQSGAAWVDGDPLFSVLERTRLRALAAPPRSARGLLASLDGQAIARSELTEEELRGLEDVDTPADAQAAGISAGSAPSSEAKADKHALRSSPEQAIHGEPHQKHDRDR